MTLREEVETGARCVECSEPMLDNAAPGYPRKCHRHGGQLAGPLARLVRCPFCFREFRPHALSVHLLRDHGHGH